MQRSLRKRAIKAAAIQKYLEAIFPPIGHGLLSDRNDHTGQPERSELINSDARSLR